MNLHLILPLPVSINKLYINQYTYNPKTKSRSPSGKRILSANGQKVKKQIQDAAIEQMLNQDWNYEYTKDHYIYMDAIIIFNRLGRDDNNIYKLNNDALEKIVYDNDSRVLTRTQRILYDSNNPRVELTFSPVEYVGIFTDIDELGVFESKCLQCKRYKNNCSILKGAKEGRVQEDIRGLVCQKFSETKVKVTKRNNT